MRGLGSLRRSEFGAVVVAQRLRMTTISKLTSGTVLIQNQKGFVYLVAHLTEHLKQLLRPSLIGAEPNRTGPTRWPMPHDAVLRVLALQLGEDGSVQSQ